MVERIEYDEFGLFHENAAEYGLPYEGPPSVRREFVPVDADRQLSALVWGTGEPELVLIHGGSQNAHTWDTVAMAMGRPLVAIDLPGHGHSDGPGDRPRGQLSAEGNAQDVAVALRALAPNAAGVVGMSLGGLTTIALTREAPELTRKVVLVDVTPGVTPAKSKQIADFINGPPSFANFDELLARTIEYNPTRTESSLRRGILHNAVQRDDGTWVWRWARWREGIGGGLPSEAGPEAGPSAAPAGPSAAPAGAATTERPSDTPMFGELWDVVSEIKVPLMLARGMLSQSVIDDADEAELLRRLPDAKIVHFDKAGHSIQGDMPVELAQAIDAFVWFHD
jgi:pimeloyl-ACP methyl ester carboxylesterase